jgi:hypothetical protein
MSAVYAPPHTLQAGKTTFLDIWGAHRHLERLPVSMVCKTRYSVASCAGQKPQNDEDDMGITYDQLNVFGRLRKMSRCGPVSMFHAAVRIWHGHLSPQAVGERVKFFFRQASATAVLFCDTCVH